MKKSLSLLPLLLLPLLSCDAPPATVVAKIQETVLQACAFRTNAVWLGDVVAKANASIQMVDEIAHQICLGVEGARTAQNSTTLLSIPPCPNGEVTIGNESFCIEGEDVSPKEEGK